ncbi:hypothetical protein P12x_000037 [Tundrisphaera lichenicola]|uniref:hypothetical protein n=1 Tax=Tundrisphaera lichenicola TaxID=2029860 RepID=UPI003EBB371B
MNWPIPPRTWFASLCVLIPIGSASAGEPTSPSPNPSPEPPRVGLLEAMRDGVVTARAEGVGDGTMSINVTNHTSGKLRVILPPGLIATGQSGQFGGFGGRGGGGRGGRGGRGGGMGGMGGGMGGMRGGMGGMGGRGGMGGGMMLTMPPTMGMMTLSRLIMRLVEPVESWDPASLMMGMMGMGGGMMGGMGGMGGRGGMMGGMGGGFRSVPPTGLPDATLKPGQTRRLSTRLVSLDPPSPETGVRLPQAGEPLLIGDIAQINDDPKVQKALRRLALDKAPEAISQMVLWNLADELDWATISQLTSGWVNAQELALARQLADRIEDLPEGESGQLFVEVVAGESPHEALATRLEKTLHAGPILGLKPGSGVPSAPSGPSVGCKVQIVGESDHPEALVRVAESDGHRGWKSMGKFSLPVPLDAEGKQDLKEFGEQLTEGLLGRLVRARLIKGRGSLDGGTTYKLQVDNASPMLLNGFALVGGEAKPDEPPHYLLGISLAPQGSLQMPLTSKMVEAYGMKKGSRLVAVDLSAL